MTNLLWSFTGKALIHSEQDVWLPDLFRCNKYPTLFQDGEQLCIKGVNQPWELLIVSASILPFWHCCDLPLLKAHNQCYI